ncbi:MAG TPA: hypothetical protein VGO43_14035 [Pyrinomonadaceae bacterium]|jgi:hypothetical protein|nr:hypothetical protein [Pyrinomonadaceae bacterium]
MLDHETAFVEAFVVPDKRVRYRELLASGKRGKLTAKLDHTRDLDIGMARSIAPDNQDADSILRMLLDLGASQTCHVISSDSRLDGQEMDLAAVLVDIVGHGNATFVSCIPGRLGYFEGAEKGERFIFKA